MSQGQRIKAVAIFCLKFLILAPICLWLWWGFLIRPYVWILGQASGGVIRNAFGLPIDFMEVVSDPEGILNSDTVLAFQEGAIQHIIQIAFMVDSLPPFIILGLATTGLGWWRRIRVIALGSAIMFAGHVSFVALAYRYRSTIAESPEIPSALGEFWLTVPFVLWIVLAYWDKASTFLYADQPKPDK